MLKPNLENVKENLRDKAQSLGFPLFGIAKAKSYQENNHFSAWLKNGYQAKMDYLSNRKEERLDLKKYFPEVNSIISVGMFYSKQNSLAKTNKEKPEIARYARGFDYHDIMKNRLHILEKHLYSQIGCKTRVCVDTSPVLDRVYAHHAGLGWFGKNTCILNRQFGSYFFIGEILTDLILPIDQIESDHCGNCTQCLDACPTEAFPEPYVLDSNKCISYLTIEHRGLIPQDQKRTIGEHLFGCDICQEVCPWNDHSKDFEIDPSYQPKWKEEEVLENILQSTPENFHKFFKGSPLKRAKWQGLLRNATLVIQNLKLGESYPSLQKALENIPKEEKDLRAEIQQTITHLEKATTPKAS